MSWKDADLSHSPAVLATVVQVEGSHYRRPGARMLAILSATPVGSVSGGCLESDVMEHASGVLRTGKSCLIHYDTTTESDLVFGSGMGCGGAVDILLEPAMSAGVRLLIHFFEVCVCGRLPLAIGTVFAMSGNVSTSVGGKAIFTGDCWEMLDIDDDSLSAEIQKELRLVLDTQKGGVRTFIVPKGTVEMFFEYLRPPIALVIFGAGDDAIPVCRMASELGWQVTVVDPRPTLLTRDRFPDAVALEICQPTSVAITPKVDAYDAAVVMTHNYESDVELLSYLFNSTVSYIGLLGASKRAERILNEITQRGLQIDEQMLDRFHAPVGLDFNAEGADEIALAIVAEIQMVLSGGTGQSLRFRRQSHAHEAVPSKGNV